MFRNIFLLSIMLPASILFSYPGDDSHKVEGKYTIRDGSGNTVKPVLIYTSDDGFIYWHSPNEYYGWSPSDEGVLVVRGLNKYSFYGYVWFKHNPGDVFELPKRKKVEGTLCWNEDEEYWQWFETGSKNQGSLERIDVDPPKNDYSDSVAVNDR